MDQAGEAAAIVVGTAAAAFHDRLDRLSAEFAAFRRDAIALIDLQAGLSRPIAAAAGAAPAPASASLQAANERHDWHDLWQEIILGNELCGDLSLTPIRRRFLADIVSGNVSARALAGELLLLQATAVDELPEQFRHVGEAYYRWRPRLSNDDDPLEKALANWLTRRAETAGLRNSIQLVSPGDRFDSSRHSATTRGVEVVAVHGWVVLRDNQKVYTKASVTLQ